MSENLARVACVQLQPAVGHADRNLDRALEAVDGAASRGVELLVLPELSTTGYAFQSAQEVREFAEPIDGPSVTALADASRNGPIIVAGICELGDQGEIYNSAVLLEDGQLRGSYRKLHLWGDEQRIFSPGREQPPVVETRVGRIGIAICYDLEFPEMPRALALRGADLIALPTNWPYVETPSGERPMLHTLAMAAARLNRVWVALCDRIGEDRGDRYLGAGILVGPDGWPLDSSDPRSPTEFLVGDCNLRWARDKQVGTTNDVFADRRTDFY